MKPVDYSVLNQAEIKSLINYLNTQINRLYNQSEVDTSLIRLYSKEIKELTALVKD